MNDGFGLAIHGDNPSINYLGELITHFFPHNFVCYIHYHEKFHGFGKISSSLLTNSTNGVSLYYCIVVGVQTVSILLVN